ncbi:hypothetical protein BVRB_8g186050 [Beta vulgaris subsp. vulgaris]|nr:hypothetical protein BVRB_8g186050 [Beta vulgaris subsp. vulgaris]
MPSFASLFSCFSSNSRHQVACEEASHRKKEPKKESKVIKKSSAPIPMSYFPSGATFSRL